jgi:hypothetical protein
MENNLGKFGIVIKNDNGSKITFYTDSYTKDSFQIMFTDVKGKPREFHLSKLDEVFPNDRPRS